MSRSPRNDAPIRCFVAILLDEEVRALLVAEIDQLRPLSRAVAWVPAANLHLTLRFLGELGEEKVAVAGEALREAAEATPDFALTLHRLGGFPGLERPRILWVGVAEGALEARTLQGRLAAALDRLGFGREERPWHPHVTIGRIFDQRRWRRDTSPELRTAVASAASRSFGGFRVVSVSLMRSDLSPEGARYSELARVPLSGRPAGEAG